MRNGEIIIGEIEMEDSTYPIWFTLNVIFKTFYLSDITFKKFVLFKILLCPFKYNVLNFNVYVVYKLWFCTCYNMYKIIVHVITWTMQKYKS